MHLWLSLPQKMEIGAQRADEWDVEVVETDGGHEVRNERASSPLREYHLAMPLKLVGDADLVALRDMWKAAHGKAYSFNFTDWIDGDPVRVRFDSSLQLTTPKRLEQHHVDTYTLKEVRDVSPEPTVLPAITGTASVGSALSVSNGTWSGSPTGYTYQWLRDGEEIAGATSSTYTLVSADSGTTVSCAVVATDAYGGQTMAFAAGVAVA